MSRVTCAALLLILADCSGPNPRPPAEVAPTPPPVAPEQPPTQGLGEPAPPPSPDQPPTPPRLPAGYLAFTGACEPGTRVTIAAVGDILLHRELQRQAFKSRKRYLDIWAGVADLLARADITYANLEGPAAYGINRKFEEVPDPGLKFDNKVYSGYARFNYHPSLAKDLKKTGVDVVSTANNHALDRSQLGVDRTLDALDKGRVKHTGTRRQAETDAPWYTVTKASGLRIAWLGCTLITNHRKAGVDQVLHCFKQPKRVLGLIAKLAKNKRIDAVIVTPHWGREYETEPRERQIEYAHKFLDAGALAVLGSHPHVLQKWEKYTTRDGRETFVIYSLGNFASHQPELPRRSTMILYLGIRKSEDDTVALDGVRYVPLHVREQDKRFYVEAIDRVGGPPDSRALTVEMFGEPHLMKPDEELVTNPHCDPAWAHYVR